MPINLGLGNLTKTLSKDKIGILIGYLATEAKYAQDWGVDFLDLTIKHLTGVRHLPSMKGIKFELTKGSPSVVLKDFVKLGLISMILKEVKIHPMVTKWARVGENVGFMGAVGVGVATAVVQAGSSEVKNPFGGGHSSGGDPMKGEYNI